MHDCGIRTHLDYAWSFWGSIFQELALLSVLYRWHKFERELALRVVRMPQSTQRLAAMCFPEHEWVGWLHLANGILLALSCPGWGNSHLQLGAFPLVCEICRGHGFWVPWQKGRDLERQVRWDDAWNSQNFLKCDKLPLFRCHADHEYFYALSLLPWTQVGHPTDLATHCLLFPHSPVYCHAHLTFLPHEGSWHFQSLHGEPAWNAETILPPSSCLHYPFRSDRLLSGGNSRCHREHFRLLRDALD